MASRIPGRPTPVIAISSGQYHFVDEEGWQTEWITASPREWYRKQLWIKAGGHSQDGKECQNS